ncbi:MAG TPA: FAD-dependent oxidoreductase [candidate division Zixibacteria bacterium]|nr:FAD-dependent oxidoreductase [candidate division Zixibacteria bacterium]
MMDKLNRIIIGSNASIFQKIDPDSNVEVFVPTNEDEIKTAITYARENKLPITTKGGGSGLSGACTGASRKKVVISTMRLKKVHEINFEKGFAIVESGITPDELNEIIQKSKPNWKFFVAPSSRDIATLGGILSTDGGGNDAWLAGTMVDNVLAVEMIDYNNNTITIEREKGEKSNLKAKITCDNKNLEKKLQEMNFSLLDISGSHGVLGFISKIKVEIKTLPTENELSYTLVHAENLNAFGKVIYDLIENNIPLSYGESIVEARHPDISGKTNPPMFIFEYPTKYDEKMKSILDKIDDIKSTKVDKEKFAIMKDIRVKMAKRNPPEGYQIALFEGYGIYGENLLRFEEIINTINKTIRNHTFEPFIKFGHAPSLWHVGNEKIKGIIMHSREKRPEKLTGEIVFNAILALVETCEKLDITPKPEHKWPYTRGSEKHKRLVSLTKVLGKEFNTFLLDCSSEELAQLVL